MLRNLIIHIANLFKGVRLGKIIKFLFFAQKVSSGMEELRPKFFRGLAALEPPKNGGQSFFFHFQ